MSSESSIAATLHHFYSPCILSSIESPAITNPRPKSAISKERSKPLRGRWNLRPSSPIRYPRRL